MARIFIVDDDEQLLQMVGLMLKRDGHSAVLLSNPLQALSQVQQEKPDLLIIDVMMPAMSGHELTRRVRMLEGGADIPILILTARSQEIDREVAIGSGADDYVAKPVTAQELNEKVKRLIKRKQTAKLEPRGTLISVFSLRGGVGRTTLAVNMAAALRRATQASVALVDFSPSGGQVSMHLRLRAKSSWADVFSPADVSWDKLREKTLVHSSGLRILAAPPTPRPPMFPSTEMAESILRVLHHTLPFTIVDLPAVLSPSVEATLKASNLIIHVVAPEVVSIQTAAQSSRILQSSLFSDKQKIFILNKLAPEGHLPTAAVERGLGSRIAFEIDYDVHQARALAQGVPLALTDTDSPLSVMTRRAAEALVEHARQT